MTDWDGSSATDSVELHPPAFIPPRALTDEHREIWVAIIALLSMQPRAQALKAVREARRNLRGALDIDEAFTRMFGKDPDGKL